MNFAIFNQIALRTDRADDNVLPLRDDDFQIRFGKMSRARQAVVSAAEDGDIVSFIYIKILSQKGLATSYINREKARIIYCFLICDVRVTRG